jgi:uncharacterized protein
MATSLYRQSVPVFSKYLNNLSLIVKKGAAFADEKAVKHDDMIQYRLVPDMQGCVYLLHGFPLLFNHEHCSLTYQVQSCCDTVVWFVDRTGGLPHQAVEDNESTFEQLYARIERTREYLKTIDSQVIDSKADSPVIMETKMGNFHFDSAQAYLSEFAIPNFHFHLASAYCILRTQGVPLGALDYLKDTLHKA